MSAPAVIIDCPYMPEHGCGKFKRGAEFSQAEMLMMARDRSLPSGTYWRVEDVTFLWYDGARYELTADGDVDESTAMRVVTSRNAHGKLMWEACG